MGIKTSRIEADRAVNHLGKKYVKNEDYVEGSSGTYITGEQIVAITGLDGSYETVSKAQADVALDRSMLWLAKQDIWEYGEVVRWGRIDLDTSASAIGNPVYLSDTAGGVSLTAGTVPIVIGKVLNVATVANGGAAWIDLAAGQPSAQTPAVDSTVVATITAAGGSGGATAGTFSIASTLGDEATAVSAAVQMLIVVSDAQYAGLADVNANVTFNTASTGTLVASGSGWALIETDATGAFACATANSADETVYFSATTPQGFSDPTDHALIISGSVSATWAA